MQPVKLAWSWTREEGKVYLSADFKQADVTLQLDALSDWIHELQMIHDAILVYECPDLVSKNED
jgi:hypothetical protein